MKQILIIPNRDNLESSLALAKEYDLGFEYNDFFTPDLLDDTYELEKTINFFQKHALPVYTTVHGTFYDVIPFSMDAKIREIANLRIEQSIDVAKKLGAKAVIFHTNYNPFLNTKEYVESWIKSNSDYWSTVLEKHPDINIYLENMFDLSPEVLEKLSENLCKYQNYGVCLDYAHVSLSDVPAELWAQCLGKYVKHVHINDNDLISDLHLSWGDGKINRIKFYEIYETYLSGASVLVETTAIEAQVRSLEQMKSEGFFEN
ncbi:MAG: sugar phosphate isomerase/epimerase [Agathobacter sp.]|nr:sugar phosphate isomerase/epimerase [Agathobacter sp.]MBQ6812250.1 sugar phosphate isomerase/epimerase [Agathobacter sp.]